MSNQFPVNTGHISGIVQMNTTKQVGASNLLVCDLLLHLPGNKPLDVPLRALGQTAERLAKVPLGYWVEAAYRLDARQGTNGGNFLSAKITAFGAWPIDQPTMGQPHGAPAPSYGQSAYAQSPPPVRPSTGYGPPPASYSPVRPSTGYGPPPASYSPVQAPGNGYGPGEEGMPF